MFHFYISNELYPRTRSISILERQYFYIHYHDSNFNSKIDVDSVQMITVKMRNYSWLRLIRHPLYLAICLIRSIYVKKYS